MWRSSKKSNLAKFGYILGIKVAPSPKKKKKKKKPESLLYSWLPTGTLLSLKSGDLGIFFF
jgi:hypothetical protein